MPASCNASRGGFVVHLITCSGSWGSAMMLLRSSRSRAAQTRAWSGALRRPSEGGDSFHLPVKGTALLALGTLQGPFAGPDPKILFQVGDTGALPADRPAGALGHPAEAGE